MLIRREREREKIKPSFRLLVDHSTENIKQSLVGDFSLPFSLGVIRTRLQIIAPIIKQSSHMHIKSSTIVKERTLRNVENET